MADYWERVESLPVLSTVPPGAVRAQLLSSPPELGEPFADLIDEMYDAAYAGVAAICPEMRWIHAGVAEFADSYATQPAQVASPIAALAVLPENLRTMTVERVYAQPVERDGTTVIAVAAVSGGGGGGSSSGQDGPAGSGVGYGLGARPVGVYVLRDGRVSWRPATDVNRLMTVVGVVAVTALLVGARIARMKM
ncbi:spore germination protein GerW family protein [Nocardia sp. CDC186]|uniref:Spore germination protein GerW family protein n=1 Tax=Nocardia implantans TaxID=3108168 RepID=A0ABU6AWL3_9NOCA|nr:MULTISPECIES: spore germination protein GerW family protein [unclassified Nocardia]MEA3529288.1 spore germination protein GerW family protein [Nocardia sp. CDC192]MEB3511874.1 spore germination protein GerW family protein [Nocardia sp. CDC186]